MNILGKLGADAVGMEHDPIFVKYAQEKGLNVVEGNLSIIPPQLSGHDFDVTVSRNVIDMPLYTKFESLLQNLGLLTREGGISVHEMPLTAIADKAVEKAGFQKIEVINRTDRHGVITVLRKH